MLDDGRQRRYCLIIFDGCSPQPPPPRPMWSTFESAVSGHGSFPNSQTTSWLSVRATSRPRNRSPNRTALRSRARRSRPCTTRLNHHAATAVRLSEVDASGDAFSAPINVNNNGIDARNGQAYHGRQRTLTNETRPASLGSRSCEEQREHRERRGRVASRVRSCPGAASRTRVLRVGTEAAASIDSMR